MILSRCLMDGVIECVTFTPESEGRTAVTSTLCSERCRLAFREEYERPAGDE